MRPHGHERVGREHAVAGAVDLAPADVGVRVHDLPLQVGDVDDVVVHDPDGAHAGRGQVQQRGAAETAGADDEHPGRLEPALRERAEPRQDEVARVPLRLGRGELRGGLDERRERHGRHPPSMPPRPGGARTGAIGLPAGRIGGVSEAEAPARGARLPRGARRLQLLGAAREVFVAQGYHAAAMDEIAERAGVSKPVLYQHFPSKRDLYLALLEQHTDELVAATREALASTTDNKQRVAATMGAFFAFIDSESESFRLVFESDFTSDPEVRELLDRMQRGCAEAIAEVIKEDTGLPAAEAELLAIGLAGIAHVTARYWTPGRPPGAPRGRRRARRPSVVAGYRRLPEGGSPVAAPQRWVSLPVEHPSTAVPVVPHRTRRPASVEVKIGIRDVAREVVLESELTPEAVAEAVASAVGKGELLRLTDDKGRLVIVPGSLIGYVEVGAPETRRVGFGTLGG